MYEVLISDGTLHSSLSLYILWGTGLHGVVISLARRKTDEFNSRVFHQREVFLVLLGYIKLMIIFVKNQFRFGLDYHFLSPYTTKRNENGMVRDAALPK